MTFDEWYADYHGCPNVEGNTVGTDVISCWNAAQKSRQEEIAAHIGLMRFLGAAGVAREIREFKRERPRITLEMRKTMPCPFPESEPDL